MIETFWVLFINIMLLYLLSINIYLENFWIPRFYHYSEYGVFKLMVTAKKELHNRIIFLFVFFYPYIEICTVEILLFS